MIDLKFDHEKNTIGDAIGISKLKSAEITAKIMFEIINQQIMVQELYDDPMDAPHELRKKTVILENIFKECTNTAEFMMATWEAARIDAVLCQENEASEKTMSMMAMLYALSKKKREKFIQTFIERVANMEDDSE
jgi:vacuolar-type H+-ATPase catalytic subunit A/Vma1